VLSIVARNSVAVELDASRAGHWRAMKDQVIVESVLKRAFTRLCAEIAKPSQMTCTFNARLGQIRDVTKPPRISH
jgi:hypothetical protein